MIPEGVIVGWLLADPKTAIERIAITGYRFKYRNNANVYKVMRECVLDGDCSLVRFFENLKPDSITAVLADTLAWTDWKIEQGMGRIAQTRAQGKIQNGIK